MTSYSATEEDENGNRTIEIDGEEHLIYEYIQPDAKLVELKVFGLYYAVEGSMRMGPSIDEKFRCPDGSLPRRIDMIWNSKALARKVIRTTWKYSKEISSFIMMFEPIGKNRLINAGNSEWGLDKMWESIIIDKNLFGVHGKVAVYLDHGIIASMIIAPVSNPGDEELNLDDYLNIGDNYRVRVRGRERFKSSYIMEPTEY
jgi:hypothetical protein